jgi:thioredoxin reductase
LPRKPRRLDVPEIVAVSGSREGQLERVRWRHNPTGDETEKAIRNVFLMIGADPATGWLRDSGVAPDEKHFSGPVRRIGHRRPWQRSCTA